MNEKLVKNRYIYIDEKKKVDEHGQSRELHQIHQFQLDLSLQLNVLKVQISGRFSENMKNLAEIRGSCYYELPCSIKSWS